MKLSEAFNSETFSPNSGDDSFHADQQQQILLKDYLRALKWYVSFLPLITPQMESSDNSKSQRFDVEGFKTMKSIMEKFQHLDRNTSPAAKAGTNKSTGGQIEDILNQEISILSAKVLEIENILADFRNAAQTAATAIASNITQLHLRDMESQMFQLEDQRGAMVRMLDRQLILDSVIAAKEAEIRSIEQESSRELLHAQAIIADANDKLLAYKDMMESTMQSMEDEHEAEFLALEKVLNGQKDHILRLEAEVRDMSLIVESTERRANSLLEVSLLSREDALSTHQRIVEAMSAKHREEIQLMSSAYHAQAMQLKDANAALVHKAAALQSELSECNDLLVKFPAQLSDAEAKYTRMIEAVETRLWSSLEDNVRLQHELSESLRSKELLATELAESVRERDECAQLLREGVQDLHTERTKLKALEGLSRELQCFAAEDALACRVEGRMQVEDMRNKLMRLSVRMVDQLDAAECNAQSSEFMQQRLQAIVKSLQEEIDSLETDKRNLQSMLSSARTELDSFKWANGLHNLSLLQNYQENIQAFKMAVSVIRENNEFLKEQASLAAEDVQLDTKVDDWMKFPRELFVPAIDYSQDESAKQQLKKLFVSYNQMLTHLGIDEDIELHALVIILFNKFQLEVIDSNSDRSMSRSSSADRFKDESNALKEENERLKLAMSESQQLHEIEVKRMALLFEADVSEVKAKLQSLLQCVQRMKLQSIEQQKSFEHEKVAFQKSLDEMELELAATKSELQSSSHNYEKSVEHLSMANEDLQSKLRQLSTPSSSLKLYLDSLAEYQKEARKFTQDILQRSEGRIVQEFSSYYDLLGKLLLMDDKQRGLTSDGRISGEVEQRIQWLQRNQENLMNVIAALAAQSTTASNSSHSFNKPVEVFRNRHKHNPSLRNCHNLRSSRKFLRRWKTHWRGSNGVSFSLKRRNASSRKLQSSIASLLHTFSAFRDEVLRRSTFEGTEHEVLSQGFGRQEAAGLPSIELVKTNRERINQIIKLGNDIRLFLSSTTPSFSSAMNSLRRLLLLVVEGVRFIDDMADRYARNIAAIHSEAAVKTGLDKIREVLECGEHSGGNEEGKRVAFSAAAVDSTLSVLCNTLESTLGEVYRLVHGGSCDNFIAQYMDDPHLPLNQLMERVAADLMLQLRNLIDKNTSEMKFQISQIDQLQECLQMSQEDIALRTVIARNKPTQTTDSMFTREVSTQVQVEPPSAELKSDQFIVGQNLRTALRENKRLRRLCSSQQLCIMALRYCN